MKKMLFFGSFGILLFSACKKTENEINPSSDLKNPTSFVQRRCGSHEAMERAIMKDPSIRIRRDAIEKFTQQNLDKAANRIASLPETGIIPVVVNVVYNTDEENISLDQINSQIDVLNEDYNAKNVDYTQVPEFFAGKKTDMGLTFKLVNVVKKKVEKASWVDDSMKFSAQGGIDATSPTTTLNIWVVNKIIDGPNEVLGYAYLPGTVPPEQDGLVIGYKYFGRTGTVKPPFDKGRTTTHEVGHWINLNHIWGDDFCGDDLVEDTPQQDAPNFGCPNYPYLSKCTGKSVEMTMNYMDYTNDACMYMFSAGQKARAMAIFHEGGPRAAYLCK
jgi:hypothetical protein